MLVTNQEQTGPCEVELTIEIAPELVAKAVDKAYKNLGKYVNVPGFRKGKAPLPMLKNVLDKERIREDVIDEIMDQNYKTAIDEANIEPFSYGEISDVEYDMEKPEEPFKAKVKVPLHPKIELGEYKGLEIEKNVKKVKDEEIDAEVKKMLERNAPFNQVFDRDVAIGDTVVVEMGRQDVDEEPKRQVLKAGSNLPQVDAAIIGMNIDDEKDFEVKYPEDFGAEELQNSSVPFNVKVIEIHEQVLPEITDEWVKTTFGPKEDEEPKENSSNEYVNTVEELRAKMREAMERAAKDVAETGLSNELIKRIVEGSTINYPEVIVEEAARSRFKELNDSLKERNVTVEDYLKYKDTTLDVLYNQYKEEETVYIKTSLVFQELIKAEDIKIDDDDIRAEFEVMAKQKNVPVETITAYVESTNGIDDIKNKVLQKKVMDFLVSASNINNIE